MMNFFKFLLIIGFVKKYKQSITIVFGSVFLLIIFNLFINDLSYVRNDENLIYIKWSVNFFILIVNIIWITFTCKKNKTKVKINKKDNELNIKSKIISKEKLLDKNEKIIMKYKNVSKSS